MDPTFIQSSAVIGDDVTIGDGTKVWHFCHVMTGAQIGKNCVLGQNVMIAAGVKIGNGCKIQNNVSVYEGVELDSDVFCGPSVVFTNVKTPRAFVSRRSEFTSTKIGRGTTLGANATIICGIKTGDYTMVGAGALLNQNTVAYGLYTGVPARQTGWSCRCGETLLFSTNATDITKTHDYQCSRCDTKYRAAQGHLQVL